MPDVDPEKISNAILQYRLPFAFDVLNCTEEGDKGEGFHISLEGIPALIRIRRVYDFRYKDDGYDFGSYSKTEEDRGGVLSHSIVQIFFDRQTLDQSTIDKSTLWMGPEQLLDKSICYVNKFISSYRFITNEFWLRNIVRKDIFGIAFFLIEDDGKRYEVTSLIPKHQSVQFNGGEEFSIDKDKEQTLRHLLISDYTDHGRDLWLDMYDKYSLGNYNTSLLQAVTYFEHFVYSNLKSKLSKKKLDKIKKKQPCGCMAGISEVCERGIKEFFEFDFGNTQEYIDLKNNAVRIRNLVVHGELLENITKDECDSAIQSVITATELLASEVFSAKDKQE